MVLENEKGRYGCAQIVDDTVRPVAAVPALEETKAAAPAFEVSDKSVLPAGDSDGIISSDELDSFLREPSAALFDGCSFLADEDPASARYAARAG